MQVSTSFQASLLIAFVFTTENKNDFDLMLFLFTDLIGLDSHAPIGISIAIIQSSIPFAVHTFCRTLL